eukprot:CAMPEP_0167755196 /NCGR_PEP_ID=MMETSP0110_2-20121227/8689_1 /TAXON_ID=629695 /ORGANISM="Gymnochlora sp., Strain CCMP2014" /LENGTH=330 /DNA_ID=CAMNT_0007641155 /DNA_START=56 /DNA_END=1045 /DNA_ORIENTATION=-
MKVAEELKPSEKSKRGEKETKATEEMDIDIKHDSLKCSLCLSLFCEPVTIPCGHTFCRTCLYQAMRRSKKKCPFCRAVCHVDPASASVTVALAEIARKLYPKQYEQRLAEVKKVKEQFENTMPIFFYNNLLFPGVPLRLHLFEQRYRHMINRAVSSNRKFIYLPAFSEYKASEGDVGLIANVDDCQFLPDGRALLKATIQKRIKVINSWIEEGTQGLHYAQFEDYEEKDSEVESKELAEIHAIANQFLDQHPRVKLELIANHIGQQPSISKPTEWSFWFSALVTTLNPQGGQTNLGLIRTVSTVQRLRRAKELFTQAVSSAQQDHASAVW